jgi:tetratricopeptide (TPR) repeat protein
MIFSVGDSQKNIERAKKLYGEGKIERAIKTLERALTGSKEDFLLLLDLGKYLFENNKFVESATNLKKAYHLAPDKWEEIVDIIESIHFAGGTPVETSVLLLEIYIDRYMFEEARKIIDASSPEQIQEITNRYDTIYNNVISKKRIEEYSRRDILNTYSLSLLRQKTNLKKGLTFYENIFLSFTEEREKILKDLERICQLNYGNPYPKFLRGKLLFFENKFEKGIQHLEMAAELNTEYIEESIKIMESIIAKDKIPLLLLYLAKYQIKQGRIEKAITYAKEKYRCTLFPRKVICKRRKI